MEKSKVTILTATIICVIAICHDVPTALADRPQTWIADHPRSDTTAKAKPGSEISQRETFKPSLGDRNTRHSAVDSFLGDISILPADRRLSLQPLLPGYTWTYEVSVTGEPKTFRFPSMDGKNALGIMPADGLFSILDGYQRGKYYVTFTVTEDSISVPAYPENQFYRVIVRDRESGKELSSDETLYWGRLRNDPPWLAVAELRVLGRTARSLLEEIPAFKKDQWYHLRYLTGDVIARRRDDTMPSFASGVVTMPSFEYAAPGERGPQIKTTNDFQKITVPAGVFDQTVRTVSRFSSPGEPVRFVTDTMFYKLGTGLVKWVQSENYTNIVVGELISYKLGNQ